MAHDNNSRLKEIAGKRIELFKKRPVVDSLIRPVTISGEINIKKENS